MPKSEYRMIKNHSGTRKTHDLADFLTHNRLVAMHLAVSAKGLFCHERALLTSKSRIVGKRSAFFAHFPVFLKFVLMIFSAIEPYHFINDILFFFPLFFYFIQTLHCLPFIFLGLNRLNSEKEIQNMTHPHDGKTNSSYRNIFHADKSNQHNSRDHSDDFQLSPHGH